MTPKKRTAVKGGKKFKIFKIIAWINIYENDPGLYVHRSKEEAKRASYTLKNVTRRVEIREV
jgi:hypothetical protein